jgi:putative spermidine/putrescine transport system ATP-binding protein
VLPPEFVAGFGGERRWASLRPESIFLATTGGHQATVVASSFLGGSTRLTLDLDEQRIQVMLSSNVAIPAVGDRAAIDWNPADMHLMDEDA